MGLASEIVNKFMQTHDTSLLADDIKFVGPISQATGIEDYMRASASFFQMVTGTRVLSQFEDGNNVCTIYEMDVKLPTGSSHTISIAEWAVVENGKLQQDHVYFDASVFAPVLQH